MRERTVLQERFAEGLARRSPEVVLFENRDLVAVNKPAGLLSHVAKGEIGVQEVVREVLGDQANIAHRLDYNTSGVLVVTRSRRARRSVAAQLENKQGSEVKKLYVALLDGEFPSQEIVEAAVNLRKRSEGIMEVVADDVEPTAYPIRSSLTYFIPGIKYHDAFEEPKTVTGVEIVTGRTHQIRVVAAHLGMPITGDLVYNDRPPEAPRQMLHALQMSLMLPGTGEEVVFEAPVPDDFHETVGALTPAKR
jgi:RluA family pseudouridine synthase